MRELSLNILDIVENSVSAEASLVSIELTEDSYLNTLSVTVIDNGKGMTEEELLKAKDPFYTSGSIRRVGMGIPIFKMAAEQTGGTFSIHSVDGKGTLINAIFKTDSLNFKPVGDLHATVSALVSANPHVDFVLKYSVDGNEFVFDTREIKQKAEEFPVSSPVIVKWIRDYIEQNVKNLYGGVTDNENT